MFVLIFVLAFPLLTTASSMQMPVGKCRYPLPTNPGLNITQVVGETFKYIYTPSAMLFKAIDSISMVIKKVPGEEHVYTEQLRARSLLGMSTPVTFEVRDVGNGVLKKITEDGEMAYTASIVAIKGDVGMLYVCSDDSDDTSEDYRYVIARKFVDPEEVKHPDVLFRETNEKFHFHGKFRKLPERFMKYQKPKHHKH